MKFLIAAAVAAAIASPAAARAVETDASMTTSVAVSTAGLDLNRAGHARLMLGRLDRAAAETCGVSTFSAREYQAAVRRTACYRDAMDRAVASVDAPAVSTLYREQIAQLAAR